jgi:hypothetical protein
MIEVRKIEIGQTIRISIGSAYYLVTNLKIYERTESIIIYYVNTRSGKRGSVMRNFGQKVQLISVM